MQFIGFRSHAAHFIIYHINFILNLQTLRMTLQRLSKTSSIFTHELTRK